MPQSESIAKLAAALSAAQGEFAAIKKQQDNPFFHSKYADLSSVLEAVQPALTKHGLALIQSPTTDIEKKTVSVETLLAHSSGEWKSSDFEMPVAEWKAQGIGSVLTYLRRYSVGAVLNIAPELDDDGNVASGHTNSENQQSQPQKNNPPPTSSSPRKQSAPKADPKPQPKPEEKPAQTAETPKSEPLPEQKPSIKQQLTTICKQILNDGALSVPMPVLKNWCLRGTKASNLSELTDEEAAAVLETLTKAKQENQLADLFKNQEGK